MWCSATRWFGHEERIIGWIAAVRNVKVVSQKRHGRPKKTCGVMTERSFEWINVLSGEDAFEEDMFHPR